MSLHKEDQAAAFTGLIGGAVLILAMCYAMVLWTSSKFEGHAAGTAPAAQGAPAKH